MSTVGRARGKGKEQERSLKSFIIDGWSQASCIKGGDSIEGKWSGRDSKEKGKEERVGKGWGTRLNFRFFGLESLESLECGMAFSFA